MTAMGARPQCQVVARDEFQRYALETHESLPDRQHHSSGMCRGLVSLG